MDKRELNEKLIQAANGGDKEKVENLLSEGAESGYKNAKGETAFTQAANGGHIDIVAKFLDQDHDINETGRNELTAISFAASRGHLDIVKVLGKKGALLDLQDGDGDTALHNAAAERGGPEIVAKFLKLGSDTGIENKNGETPEQRDVVNLSLKEFFKAGRIPVLELRI